MCIGGTELASQQKPHSDEICAATAKPDAGSCSSQVDSLDKEFGKLKDDVYEAIKSQPVGRFKVRLTERNPGPGERAHILSSFFKDAFNNGYLI